MKKICLVSLGCDKNTVDSETILGFFANNGFTIIKNPAEADAIVINTCGFIEKAKTESLDTIFKYAKYKKKLIVTGCLVERYIDELKLDLSDIVDLFIPISDYKKMAEMVKELFPDEIKNEYNPYYRIVDNSFSAYLKISDGCNHFCGYCAIPLIRGRFKSIPKEEILSQAHDLVEKGKTEIIVVSQDTSCYGIDIYKDYDIVSLLKDLLQIKGIKSIRLLYLYAHEITDDFINLIKENSEVLQPYFDIPIQHCNDEILKKMNRKDTKEGIAILVNKIRTIFPKSIIRTTLIVGYPGETEETFKELINFIQDVKFDHLGAFTYSCEEGTYGATLPNQVDESIKLERYNRLLKAQMEVSYSRNKKHIGETMTGFVIGETQKHEYLLRSYFNAPDDIDGEIIFQSKKSLKTGDVAKIKIESCDVYDLYGVDVTN